jgi:hypothetical protein
MYIQAWLVLQQSLKRWGSSLVNYLFKQAEPCTELHSSFACLAATDLNNKIFAKMVIQFGGLQRLPIEIND